MNDKSFWAKYIRWSDKYFAKKWYIILSCIFAPVFFFLELFSMKKIWDNFILDEIGENEDFCKWLDINEFGIEKKFGTVTRIYKKDIIMPDDEKLGVYKAKELEYIIYNEYNDAFIEKLEKYFQFDIENYVSLLCDVTVSRIQDSHDFIKIYEISLVFYRYDRFIIALRTLKSWLYIISLTLLSVLAIIFLTNYFR